MKKVIILTAIAVLSINATNGQRKNLGVKGGLNRSSFTGTMEKMDAWEDRMSPAGGLVLNMPVSELFSIRKFPFLSVVSLQGELLYSPQGVEEHKTEDAVAIYDYINLPILVDVTLLKGLSVQAGPQIGVNINSELDIKGAYLTDSKLIIMDVVIGAQYRVAENLFFQLRYTLGVSEINSDTYFGVLKNSVFNISVGYFFKRVL